MKPFASSADLGDKKRTLEVVRDGVYVLTAEGDPNVGAIEGEDFVVCFDALATPASAAGWLDLLREQTRKPVRYLALSHYHAVRVLGASAFDSEAVVAHERTAELVEERGVQDWESEQGRMPRLFEEPEGIPGLTYPTLSFADRLTIDLGGTRGSLVLQYLGRGHTEGDIVAWLPEQNVVFAGDLVEAEAALYTGDAFHREWSSETLDAVKALGAETLIGGRGQSVHGVAEVGRAIEQTRGFLSLLLEQVEQVQNRGGSLKEAFDASHAALAPQFGHWPIFEHCLPFDVTRVWEELSGTERPTVWTAERDRSVWEKLQA